MEKDQLIKFLTWPGSTPIERIAAEEILRLREEVERLKTMVFRSEVLEIRSSDSQPTG